jgi:ER lumen protein retaining receptor
MRLGYYLVFMALSRVMRMCFWIMQYLNGDEFIYLILADVIHTIILGDFVYCFFKHRSNERILLY